MDIVSLSMISGADESLVIFARVLTTFASSWRQCKKVSGMFLNRKSS